MSDYKDKTLLIVDDEPGLRNAIAFEFKRKGFNVLTAENGKAAFAIIKREKVDLVLSDIRMPGGDGVDLLKEIKAINLKVPILMFITGFAEIAPEQAIEMGAAAVFTKPFDRKELVASVIKAVTKT